MRHHLNADSSARAHDPAALAPDLRGPPGPIGPVLERLAPELRAPVSLSEEEVRDLVAFVRDGLLDPSARPERLRRIIPEKLPIGRTALTFQFP